MNRNVVTLTIAQGLAASGMTVMPVLGGIVGAELAPRPALATVPVSLAVVGLALTTVPAALLMRRVGRRNGFLTSACVAAAAAAIAAWSVAAGSYAGFCAGAFLLGSQVAFTLQYRFAAAESVAPHDVSRAVSTVMLGTLAGAFIGPQIALATRHTLAAREFAGSFLSVTVLYLVAALVLTRLAPAAQTLADPAPAPARPLGRLVKQPAFAVAVLAGVVAYSVMSFIMTATPISMHVIDGHAVDATTLVIQSHLLAMYLPSLVSGRLIARVGIRPTMIAGIVLMLLCVAVDLGGHHVMHYWWGLVLLGAGWNLLFVAGTTLLTTTYRAAERHRAQAINEFAIFGLQALASLLAGVAIETLGWSSLNLATLPLLAAMLITVLWIAPRRLAPAGA